MPWSALIEAYNGDGDDVSTNYSELKKKKGLVCPKILETSKSLIRKY